MILKSKRDKIPRTSKKDGLKLCKDSQNICFFSNKYLWCFYWDPHSSFKEHSKETQNLKVEASLVQVWLSALETQNLDFIYSEAGGSVNVEQRS